MQNDHDDSCRDYVGYAIGVRGKDSLHNYTYDQIATSLRSEISKRRNPVLCSRSKDVSSKKTSAMKEVPMSHLHRTSADEDALHREYLPHEDVAFTENLVSDIIDAAWQMPTPWGGDWQRSVQVALARRYQYELQKAPALDKEILQASTLSTLWIVMVMLWMYCCASIMPSVIRKRTNTIDHDHLRTRTYLQVYDIYVHKEVDPSSKDEFNPEEMSIPAAYDELEIDTE